MVERVGITMRIAQAGDYYEPRDCLAQDWYPFLDYALPELHWLLVPNIGADVVGYAERLGIDGFILPGGNDIGDEVVRDETEHHLIAHGMANGLPVFGVCRGLQLIQHYFEGSLIECARETHVAKRHAVTFVQPWAGTVAAGDSGEVNSYHTQAVSEGGLAPPLQSLAVTDDGVVEGVVHPEQRVAAVMWHPERNTPYADLDRLLIRAFFGLEI